MPFGGRKATVLLFIGDIGVFAFSLWVTLLLRYGTWPSPEMLALHAGPFLALFALWTLVFYMAGLYGKQVIRFKTELWGAILRTQVLNIVLAALFFFLTPQIGITPKTNLAIYLVVSLVGICLWRLVLYPRISKPSARLSAAIIGEGPEVEELVTEVNSNARYPFQFMVVTSAQNLQKDFTSFVHELKDHGISLLVVDAEHDTARAVLPAIYQLAFVERRLQFADFYRMYEEVFDRVPLSLLHRLR